MHTERVETFSDRGTFTTQEETKWFFSKTRKCHNIVRLDQGNMTMAERYVESRCPHTFVSLSAHHWHYFRGPHGSRASPKVSWTYCIYLCFWWKCINWEFMIINSGWPMQYSPPERYRCMHAKHFWLMKTFILKRKGNLMIKKKVPCLQSCLLIIVSFCIVQS